MSKVASAADESMPRGASAVVAKETIRLPELDRWLLFAALALLTLGLLMVASASMPQA